MNEIKFNTILNDDGHPFGYDITGCITVDNEVTELGFSCFYFEKAFNELCYWVNQCPSAKVTYTTGA